MLDYLCMLKAFGLIASLLLIEGACAQSYSFKGKILNENQEALPGATIQLSGEGTAVVSDGSGQFVFESLPPKEYIVTVRYVGYATTRTRVNLQGDSLITFVLKEQPLFTDEVIVTATRATHVSPVTYTTVNIEVIAAQNFGQDLPMLLNWTPSVVTTSDAGNGVGYTGIRIRGSDATRINVTINGVPYNDSESQGTFWVNISDIAASAESIQIQRGVGLSTHGAGAFGGTISVNTLSKRADPYARITNSFGSFNTRRHMVEFGTGLLNDTWTIDGRLSRIKSDGFIDRAFSDLYSYYLSGGYYKNKTIIKLLTFGGQERTYQSWYGVPQSRLESDEEAMLQTAANEGWNEEQTLNLLNSNPRTFNPYLYENQIDNYRQEHFQLHLSQQLSSSTTANLSFHYTPGTGYFEEYRYADNFSNYGLDPVAIGDSIIASADIVRRRWLDNDFYGLTYSAIMNANKLGLTLGGAYNVYRGKHFGEIIWSEISVVPTGYKYYQNDSYKEDFSTFIKGQYQFSPIFSAYLDLQLRNVFYRGEGIENLQNQVDFNKTYSFLNPKLGFVYTLKKEQQLYGSFGVGNREPVRDDFVNAAPDRLPLHETLLNTEFGFRQNNSNGYFHANLYWMDYKNQLVLTGQLNDVGAATRTNVRNSYRVGLELEWLMKLNERISWVMNATISQNKIRHFDEVLYDYSASVPVETRNTFTETHISYSPGFLVGSQFLFQPFKGGEVELLSKYVGRQYLDNTSDRSRSIDPYVVQDLRLSYRFQLSGANMALAVLVNNLLNTQYESNGYTWGYLFGRESFRENYFYPQAGRNFLVKLDIAF